MRRDAAHHRRARGHLGRVVLGEQDVEEVLGRSESGIRLVEAFFQLVQEFLGSVVRGIHARDLASPAHLALPCLCLARPPS